MFVNQQLKMKKMKKKYFKSLSSKKGIVLILLATFIMGCNEDFFDKQPLDQASDATFWKTEGDAQLALVGCYNTGAGWQGEDFWTPRSFVYLDLMAGNGSEKELIPDHVTDGALTSSYWVTANYWSNAYKKITTCNNFLDHIEGITMDASKKAVITAEVRTLRAYQYFNLALYFGDVPLVKHVLSMEEANSVSRTPKAEVWSFVETELKESAAVLPETRDAENGRLTAGAALGILGRLQMAEKKWSDATATYKKIIDFKCYSIDPKYGTFRNKYSGIQSWVTVIVRIVFIIQRRLINCFTIGAFVRFNQFVKRRELVPSTPSFRSHIYKQNMTISIWYVLRAHNNFFTKLMVFKK